MAKISVDKALLKAKSHAKKGEVEEAQKLYQAILNAFPKNKRAQKGLAALKKLTQSAIRQDPPQETINQLINFYNQGKFAAVVEQAQTLTEQYPDAFILWNIIGVANKGLGKSGEASKAFKKVTLLNPNYADGFNNLGVTLNDQGKLDEAIASYKQALSLKPDYTEAFNNMGNALQDQSKLDEAIRAYNKALAINPDYAEASYNLGVALTDKGKLDDAIEAYKKALSLKPNYAEASYNMGNAFKDKGELNEAIASYSKALSLKPDYAEAYNNMGNAFQDQGKIDEAIGAYNKALVIKPVYAEAHRNLSSLIKYNPDNTQVTLVRKMIKQTDLKEDDRCHLHYTFAKMKEDLGDLDAAYDNYVVGGKLRKKMLSYDFKQDKRTFDQIKITAPKLKKISFNKPIEAATNTPIFILGMPRSGTTLVEQIISCHSQVHGAGELSYFSRFGGKLSQGVQDIKSGTLLKVRNSYLNEIKNISANKQIVTDKMPQNFLYIGLILKALPEAKIIHVKRDPAATCWSNFKHYFSQKGLGYSYTLNDTVAFFKLYKNLMKFWDQHYGSKIYHLDYDRLTIDQEIETKKLIDHLELGWEDACLLPQDNKRSVRTASQQQVREKVYGGSSQAWRKFEPYLNGTFDELLT